MTLAFPVENAWRTADARPGTVTALAKERGYNQLGKGWRCW